MKILISESSNKMILTESVLNDIKNNFPSVNIISIILTPTYESNAIQLDIVYSIYGSTAQNIQITF